MDDRVTITSKFDYRLLAAISYLWIMVLVPIMFARHDEFVNFHARQGVILSIGWIGVFVLQIIHLGFISPYLALVLTLLMFFGLITAFSGDKKQLPVVGMLAYLIKI